MVKAVLLDLAGVLYDGARAVPGAAAAVDRLRGAGLAVRFLTNSTRTPRRALIKRLTGLGFEVAPGEVFTPAIAARERLIRVGQVPHLLIHPDLAEDFREVPSGETATAVVVGDAGAHFTYDRLNTAFRVLIGGADLYALAANRSFRDADGELSMDAGAFVAALEFAARVRARVLGKPAPAFFAAALKDAGAAAADAVMIGDDAEADVAGALNAGLGCAILVRTGKYRPGDETRATPCPTLVARDIAEAVDRLLG